MPASQGDNRCYWLLIVQWILQNRGSGVSKWKTDKIQNTAFSQLERISFLNINTKDTDAIWILKIGRISFMHLQQEVWIIVQNRCCKYEERGWETGWKSQELSLHKRLVRSVEKIEFQMLQREGKWVGFRELPHESWKQQAELNIAFLSTKSCLRSVLSRFAVVLDSQLRRHGASHRTQNELPYWF